MTPFAVGGIVAWAIAWLAVVALDGPRTWAGICLAGVLLGIPGLATMLVHDRNRARRRAQVSAPEAR